jgi:hypothetical protein
MEIDLYSADEGGDTEFLEEVCNNTGEKYGDQT